MIQKNIKQDSSPICQQYDYRGMKCPLPVLKARRALSQVQTGQKVEFITDDPASPLDMAHFCDSEGHHLHTSHTSHTSQTIFSFIITKG